MTSIAFIGLGIMGAPMAAHLVSSGHDVIGVNRGQEPVRKLIEQGGRGARTIREAVAVADVVITMLPDSPDVEGAVYGEEGIYENARAGTLHIDCSSIRPDVAHQIAEAGARRGVGTVDAPVSGGETGAKDATLSIMIGGSSVDVERARPILEELSTTLVHVGPSGSGQTVKAANQLVVAGTLQLIAEALVFLEAHGVDTEAALAVLAGGLAGSTILDRKAGGMQQRSFAPGFRVELHHKDMGIVTSAARTAGVAIPLGAHVAQLVGSLRAMGHGDLDHSALLLLTEQLSGRGKSRAGDTA